MVKGLVVNKLIMGTGLLLMASTLESMECRPVGPALSRALLARSSSSGLAVDGSSPRSATDVQVPFVTDEFARRDLELERARLEGDRAAFELERARVRAVNAARHGVVQVRESRDCCGRFCESIYNSWCFRNFAAPTIGFCTGFLAATAALVLTQPECKGSKAQ